MLDARINCWTAAFEADKLQIELVVNSLANIIRKKQTGQCSWLASNLAWFGILETDVHVNFQD